MLLATGSGGPALVGVVTLGCNLLRPMFDVIPVYDAVPFLSSNLIEALGPAITPITTHFT